jgi:hypothetical protein
LRFVNKKSLKTPIIFVNRSLKSKKEGKYNNQNEKLGQVDPLNPNQSDPQYYFKMTQQMPRLFLYLDQDDFQN